MSEKTPKLVVGISASPRRGANTDTVVNEILAGASEAGAETEFLRLGDLSIAPCRACYWCRDHSGCAVEDDMGVVYDALLRAHRWVIGTPIYWYTLTSLLKSMIERTFAWYMDPAGRPTKGMGKKAAIITLCGDADAEGQGAPVFKIFDTGLPGYGVEIVARMALQGVGLDEVASRWADYRPARELGKNLVI